jgi:hypothetical protein
MFIRLFESFPSIRQVRSTRRLRSQRVTLPWDCLLLVFRKCDSATLAQLGRVSLDVLTVTSALLYPDVELRSLQALTSLFRDRKPGQVSTPASPFLRRLCHVLCSGLIPHRSCSTSAVVSRQLSPVARQYPFLDHQAVGQLAHDAEAFPPLGGSTREVCPNP